MIKSIACKCPRCNKSNAFNIDKDKELKDISIPWFMCSFCFKPSDKEEWVKVNS